MKADIKNHLHPRPHLGHEFERKMTAARNEKLLSVDEEVSLRGRCTNIVIALVSQLQLRLADNVEILEKVSLLAPDNCLRAVKPSIIPLAELMCEPPDVITKIDYQWSKLSLVEWQNTDKTVAFWCEVRGYKDAPGRDPFFDLTELAGKCIVLPGSNGDVERIFSLMNLTKSPLWNKFKDDMMVAIMTIRSGLRRVGKCCDSYEFPASVCDIIGTMAVYESPEAADDSFFSETDNDLTEDDWIEIDNFVSELNALDSL